MHMLAGYAHACHPKSKAAAASPVVEKRKVGFWTTGFDWFFASGILMVVGLVVTFVLVVA